MRANLDDVFASVGVRSGEPGDDGLIGKCVRGANTRERRVPRRQLFVRSSDRARYVSRRGTADADHPDAATAWRRRDGDDRVIRRESHRGRSLVG